MLINFQIKEKEDYFLNIFFIMTFIYRGLIVCIYNQQKGRYMFDVEEPITLSEAAEFMKRTERHLRNLMQTTDIPYYKFDSRPTFLKSELINWIKQYNVRSELSKTKRK